MYIFGYKTTLFIQNLYILVKFFGKNFIFRVKSKFFLFFQDQMYIFGYKTTFFIQNLYILVKCFGKNFNFRVKRKIFLFFQDEMYIFGNKTIVFIQNLYILVKLLGKNFIFRKTFTKMYKFCIKSVVLYQKCTFGAEKWKKMYFLH